ncbi:uncharacterized protein LOC135339989 isoform X2 [Halichondria panicea]|uniref:uncharacterized protein LOC135339989 isoform X2 n=1 Tax=Halichondria panicea TaxID=6063 RepID=UPI00312B4989
MRLVTIPRSRSENFTIPVPSGSYTMITFDLENSSLPRIPISMAADVKNMTMATTGGEGSTSPPPSKGISATKLTNGSVEVTCSDSALSCLVLFQSSTTILDGVIVGFINSTYNSTVLSLKKDYGDGYVVVYSWNSLESIFEGEVSFIIQLDLLTTAPTTPPTSDPQTDPPPPNIESLPISVIAGRFLVL